MMKFVAAVLSVIAVGVLAIAYGLLSPRLSMNDLQARQAFAVPTSPAANSGPAARQADFAIVAPVPSVVPVAMPPVARTLPANQPDVIYLPASSTVADADVVRAPAARPVRAVYAPAASREVEIVTTERSPRRDWKRTAMIIGGTSAASAGVGAIVGGKKGALIGAAIGGGASTIYQTTR